MMGACLGFGALTRAGSLRAQGPATQQEHVHDHMGSKPSVPSTSLVVTVDGRPHSFSPGDLAAMPQKMLKVKNGHSGADEIYTGVTLQTLLAKCGFDAAPGKRLFHSYVRAEGTDQYWVLYSASELEGLLTGNEAIVALAVDGKPLGSDGRFKIVDALETEPARWVRNLKSLTVVTAE